MQDGRTLVTDLLAGRKDVGRFEATALREAVRTSFERERQQREAVAATKAREEAAIAAARLNVVKLVHRGEAILTEHPSSGAPQAVADARPLWYARGPAGLCFCLLTVPGGYAAAAGDESGVHPIEPQVVATDFPYDFRSDGKGILTTIDGRLIDIDLEARTSRVLLEGELAGVVSTRAGFAVGICEGVALHAYEPGGTPRELARLVLPQGELKSLVHDEKVLLYEIKMHGLAAYAIDLPRAWALAITAPSAGFDSVVRMPDRTTRIESSRSRMSFEILGLDQGIAEAKAKWPDGEPGLDATVPARSFGS